MVYPYKLIMRKEYTEKGLKIIHPKGTQQTLTVADLRRQKVYARHIISLMKDMITEHDKDIVGIEKKVKRL